jgi:DNA processing protein
MHFCDVAFPFSPHILWFLQSHLTSKERTVVSTLLFQNELFKKFPFPQEKDFIQQILYHSKLREENKKNILDLFYKSMTDNLSTQSVLSRFHLQQILQKPFKHPALLAFQYLGNPLILKKPLIALIGSRRPTYEGRKQAELFSKYLAQQKCTILSGGAIGIDTIANSVALEYGSSCAIVGSGLQRLYPLSNKQMFHTMFQGKNGLILSEFPTHSAAQKWFFPRRNLSLAALADFVFVIEASATSGSLITASAAKKLGIPLGALCSAAQHSNSAGNQQLIQKGAFCVKSPSELFEIVRNQKKDHSK